MLCCIHIAMRVYLYVWIEVIYDVIRRGKGQGGPSIKAEPISAAGEGVAGIIDCVRLLYSGIIIIFILYVLAVLKHALG